MKQPRMADAVQAQQGAEVKTKGWPGGHCWSDGREALSESFISTCNLNAFLIP